MPHPTDGASDPTGHVAPVVSSQAGEDESLDGYCGADPNAARKVFHERPAKTLAGQTTTSVLPRSEGQAEECDGGLRTPAPGGMELADEEPADFIVIHDIHRIIQSHLPTGSEIAIARMEDAAREIVARFVRTAAQSAVRERTITTVQEKLVDQKFCWCIVRVLHDEEIIQNFGSGLDAKVAAFCSLAQTGVKR